ncbi:sorting nexin-1a [Xyrichtys novacula]|uniref:Sorting nexin-1 n=1 Tax=Xyrichtys novacula TaxID=13765 RepID=A0AAV1F513_XYRNO|nr:sorting nexin-1a [Xyrichtys novacula]
MATSSERSPPPFPDSEDQDVLDTEEVGGRDSDEDDGEDLFMSSSDPLLTEMDPPLSDVSSPPTEIDPTLPPTSQASDVLMEPFDLNEPPVDIMSEPVSDIMNEPAVDIMSEPAVDIMSEPLIEPIISQTEKIESEVTSEPSDDFVDLTNNIIDSPDDSAAAESAVADAAKDSTEIALDEPSEEFVDIFGGETEAPQEEVVAADMEAVETAMVESEATTGVTDPPSDENTGSDAELEVEETPAAPVIDLSVDLPATETQPAPSKDTFVDPLVDLLSDTPPAAAAAAAAPEAKKSTLATIDLFEDEGSDLFSEPLQTKPAKQPQKSLFGEADEDLFGEPLGATTKKTVITEQKEVSVTTKAAVETSVIGGPLLDSSPVEPADIFTEEAVTTVPSVTAPSTVNSKTNGVHSEEEPDIFAEATVELSLDSPRDERKTDVTAKPSVSAPSSLSAAASMAKPQSAALEELQEEEEEEHDKFDIFVSVKDPEKIGDGMTAYMAYKVATETTLPMFRNKNLTVRRRFSDFLGLYEKLSEKHGPNGYIVPPPPEKSILGMTKVKVGKEDSSSADFVERRRGALERYLQRVVNHPSLIQDPDVREFLEREDLPRAVSTQALSGAGFLKMLNKATDAVSKMTIKMNESDVWFEEKLQEVESADQHFRKLHALVESLVLHRKELSLNTASFAKSAAMLGSAEDNTALSRALSQLSEVEDKIEQLHQDQAANDTFNFAEVIADYLRLLGAVRGSFDHRMKAWQRWQDAQAALQKKRETEAKLLWANKPDKLQLAKEEIAEWEAKVTQYERDFERVSATVRKEVVRFEKEKAKNFKQQVIKYLEALLQSQQQLIKYWEAFLPEAKAIA